MHRILIASLLLSLCSLAKAEPVVLTETGSLLYYNTPAAVRVGHATVAGWIEKDGSVVVAKIAGNRVRKHIIHKYGVGDDHGAPAIAVIGRKIFVATSQHSSELFVYRLDKRSLSATLHCRFEGKFTYPRWIGSRLLVRRETDLPSGDLAVLNVSKRGCGKPKTVIKAERNEYIYATSPASIDRNLWVSYTIYSLTNKRHEGVFAANITSGRTVTIRDRRTDGPELLAWSIAKGRIRFVAFEGNMECCDKGTMRLIETDMGGRELSVGHQTAMPYYPSVSEAPCGLGGLRYMSQRFAGGHIASEITGTEHHIRSFQSRVFICPGSR